MALVASAITQLPDIQQVVFGYLQNDCTLTLKAHVSIELYIRLLDPPLNDGEKLTLSDDTGLGIRKLRFWMSKRYCCGC